MAVQKSRKTPSKRNMRRSHSALKTAALSVDSTTGNVHRRHHVGADGYYRGKKLVRTANVADVAGQKQNKEVRGRISIPCPKVFSLRENFEGVVEVLNQIRTQSDRQRNENCYIDFREIRHLSPAAALVLAAELDRWNRLPGEQKRRLKPVDVSKWDPHVRKLLGGMGFFELLQVKGQQTHNVAGSIEYVKFETGSQADGRVIDSLRKEKLDPVVGGVPGKLHLYNAVTEAMTNVVHHAYKDRASSSPRHGPSNWWLSASYDSSKREVIILIYDQGAGIPNTLARRFRERIAGIVSTNHAEMIQAAHALSRSASEKQHRGHGLQRDVRAYLENLPCDGEYRVVSLRGEYVSTKDANGSRERLKNHAQSLHGTLIEWRLHLKDES